MLFQVSVPRSRDALVSSSVLVLALHSREVLVLSPRACASQS